MSLKIAIGGKGGVGKTTITALLARCLAADFAANGGKVIAIDADPVTNLAAGLGIPEDLPITPIAELRDLIAERTGATPGTMGGFFTLNPKVDDIPERFARERDGVRLLVMGTVKTGGSGCICPESTILKALMTHLVLHRDEIVLMDMEAGIEHLGRGTATAVDALIVVVNPGARSRAAAATIKKLGQDIGIKNIAVVGNRVRGDDDIKLIREALADFPILGFIPEQEEVAKADREGRRPFENIVEAPPELFAIVDQLRQMASKRQEERRRPV